MTTHKRLPVNIQTEYNPAAIIRALRKAALRAGWSAREIDDMIRNLKASDSNSLWSVAREYCE